MAVKIIPPLNKEDKDRFWCKIRVDSIDGCWIWSAKKDSNGYGHFQITSDGKTSGYVATRIMWFLVFGEIERELCVLHRCDNPTCVNPAHLFLGTKSDNSRDMLSKGRGIFQKHPEKIAYGDRNGSRIHPERLRRGDTHHSRLHPERLPRGDEHHSKKHPEVVCRGERLPQAVLRETDVIEIRRLHHIRAMSQRKIADKFNVGETTISDIIHRKRWTHI